MLPVPEIVSVTLLPGVTGLGLNVATPPTGTPVADMVTGPVKPPILWQLIVYTAFAGAHTDCEVVVATRL